MNMPDYLSKHKEIVKNDVVICRWRVHHYLSTTNDVARPDANDVRTWHHKTFQSLASTKSKKYNRLCKSFMLCKLESRG